jgi:hypothetical protein
MCLYVSDASAQAACTTTVDCAQKAVEAAVRAEAAAKGVEERLNARIDAFERALAGGRVLAIAYIRERRLSHSSAGVSFDPTNGVVTFPNPKGLPFVPVISTVRDLHYATEMNYIREVGASSFRVWKTTLDTGDRNSSPADFAAVVIGFEKGP